MEAKLKSLKVVDLKQILTRASAVPAGKANKADLIAKIIATPAAVDAFNALHPSKPAPHSHDDLLAPPEDLDWTVDEVPPSKSDEAASEPTTETPAPLAAELTTAPISAQDIAPEPQVANTAESTSYPADAELEKRKQRAARFGIPLVETKPRQRLATAIKTNVTATQPSDDAEKIKARAERFGLKIAANGKTGPSKDNQTSPGSKRKRGAVAPPPEVEVDLEELERRRKRAERFALKP
ncbi:hypothetical protein F5879DRAFT_1008593 [Lentinula edodes]|uniref:uncharacterized protein n=1 Tax=Lentinula edodes TaxID=5353 RepID=UPI001E8E727B|nr:uncharacterized protein C8R40DRAFT_1045485 [Lentinula edodes]KAH7875208.1 hypothetical protein C8R40DRAFT_1045485 [Lentinula edodes]KAJ3906941.1 hypothetical protein F5879DRAFT_1008593 [Lentinula edodes]KAJ3915962.1 hypothetical protein F5877DRAFT_91997 [Lentinula edodes]